MSSQPIAALYARTSHEKDDAFSLSSQLVELWEAVKTEGFTVPKEYVFQDECTGKVADRPELNKVRKLMHEGAINVLAVFDASRFARKIGVADLLLDEVFECGVQLYLVSWGGVVKDSIRDRKVFYDESIYADIERRKILERTMRGKRDKLAQGIWIGTGIQKYGFATVGKKRETRLVFVDTEIEVVRNIFQWFVHSGYKVADILPRLNASEYPTPSVAKGLPRQRSNWTDDMVYRILKDECYTGVFYAHKYYAAQSGKNPNKRTTRIRAQEEWTRLDFPHLQIVDVQTFQKAQEQLSEGRRMFAPNPINEYLCARFIRCKHCDYAVNARTTHTRGHAYRYYNCGSYEAADERKRDCKLRASGPRVDTAVFRWITSLLEDPEAILAGYQRTQQIQKQRNQEAATHVDSARRVFERYESELKDYAEMYTRRLITLNIMAEKKAELDERIKAAKEVLEEYEAKASQDVLTDEDIRDRVTEIKKLRDVIQDIGSLTFAERRRLVKLLNLRFQLGIQEGRHYVDILWCGDVQASYFVNNDLGEERRLS